MEYIRISDEDMEWNQVNGNILTREGKQYRIVGFVQATYEWILMEE